MSQRKTTKLDDTRRQGIKILAILFIVGIAVFIGYAPTGEEN